MTTPTSPLYLLHTQPDARLLAAWVARHHARHAAGGGGLNYAVANLSGTA